MNKTLKTLIALDVLDILIIVLLLAIRNKRYGNTGWIIAWPLVIAVLLSALILLSAAVSLTKKIFKK